MLEILTVEIGGHRYALPAADVDEVLRAVSFAKLPEAPPIIEGAVNVRGEVLPVLDLRARFHLPEKSLEPTDHLVVARAGERRVAIRVDRATALVKVPARDIEDAHRLTPRSEYIAGIAKLPEGLTLIHDLRTFLSEAEAEALAVCMNGAAAP